MQDKCADLEVRLFRATEELADVLEGSGQQQLDSRDDQEVMLQREERIILLEEEREDLRIAKARLEDQIEVLTREREGYQATATSGSHTGPNGFSWELEYRKLQDEHDEVLQCLAEMELEHSAH